MKILIKTFVGAKASERVFRVGEKNAPALIKAARGEVYVLSIIGDTTSGERSLAAKKLTSKRLGSRLMIFSDGELVAEIAGFDPAAGVIPPQVN